MAIAMADLKEFWTKKTVVGLGLGQFLSLLITSTGFSSSELARRGINAPTSQSFLNYLLLAIIYGSFMIYRRKPLKAKWCYYILLGLVDVEANFLGGSNPVKGDLLVIAGATLYAVSNVSEDVLNLHYGFSLLCCMQEFFVKSADRIELMAFLGLFGAIISACQMYRSSDFSVSVELQLFCVCTSVVRSCYCYSFLLFIFLFFFYPI